ncbi:hypothetical protein HZC53_01595 [Candidatus Uhrbacteria bacterium]|nr:hypothetical protein [Candidatus Uhrbacteria bacterium]
MNFRPVLVFLATSAVCALFMPWSGFGDPDGFYHAKISSLLWQSGPVKNFPWLDLTSLGQHFADLHFLFHAFVAPFTAVFGMFLGLRIAIVVLAGLFFAVFDYCLRKLRLPHPLLWIFLLFMTQPFLFRILLAKATPLALMLFIAGLTAAWLRKPWLVLLLTMLFSLSHGGWLYLAGSIVLITCGQIAYFKFVEDKTWSGALRESMWLEIAAGFVGGLVGMLVHPNFPQNFISSWTQVFVIGLGTPFQHVMLGLEWQPAGIKALFTSYAPWIVVGGLGLAGMFLAPRKPLDRDRAMLTASVGWVAAVLFALTLKSRRNTEYLAPIVALWVATFWSHVDARKMAADFWASFKKFGKWNCRILVTTIVVLGVGLLMREGFGAWDSLHSGDYPDEIYRGSMAEISKVAKPGDRVFHSSWDEFPILFAADDRLRYIAGLDPTFLYVASSTLSDDVKNLTWGLTSSTREQAWELIHDRLDSKFVFVGKKNHEQFLELIQSDERYVNIADFPDSAAFVVRGFR